MYVYGQRAMMTQLTGWIVRIWCYSSCFYSFMQVKLLNTKNEEEYMLLPSGDDTIISRRTSEWLEIPVLHAESYNMLPST